MWEFNTHVLSIVVEREDAPDIVPCDTVEGAVVEDLIEDPKRATLEQVFYMRDELLVGESHGSTSPWGT